MIYCSFGSELAIQIKVAVAAYIEYHCRRKGRGSDWENTYCWL